MIDKQLILFDLDGTVIDSGEGVKNSVLYALSTLGYPLLKKEEMDPFLGPPLVYSFHHFAGVPEAECAEAVRLYREYYQKNGGMFQYALYAGMPELLRDLRAAGYKTAIATSKPQPYAIELMHHAGIFEYLDHIVGADLDEITRAKKSEVIEAVLEESGVGKANALMIGDRKYDVLGAKEVGVESLGITFGYGDRAELTEAGADLVLDTVDQLRAYLLG
ncbi:MAG: HAD hydrolase-like protein [Clostridia bacterium]|nr:HAD hydrolase-like protein [Clostridia bacterium]